MPVNRMHIERIKELAKAYGAARLILFGSAVDMPKKAKDIDIVPLSPPTRFTQLIEKKGKVLI